MTSETKRRIYTLLVTAVNVAVQVLLVGYVWWRYYNSMIRIAFWVKGHIYIMSLYAIVLLLFMHIYGATRVGYLKRWDAMLSHLFATICANVFFYAEIALLAYKFPTVKPLAAATVLAFIFELIWLKLVLHWYRRLFPPHKVLLVYGREKEQEAREKLAERRDKFQIIRAVPAEEMGPQELGEYDAVMLWDIPNAVRNRILKKCYGKRIRIYTMPSLSDLILSGAEMMHFFDTPLFLIRGEALTIDQRFVKRAMDIVLAVLLLLVLWPFMLLTALAIYLYDRGPILYKQTRCSLYGKEFSIYKFRSMIADAEKDGVARLAGKSDDRITPVGKWIRKTRLDELPQLFNVLWGDMSFVGPRPERPELVREYEKDLPEFDYRMHVKAGLTGYAQIYGKYNTVPYDKLKLDLYYVEHYSLWQDIQLLIQTTKIVFSPDSTEGVK